MIIRGYVGRSVAVGAVLSLLAWSRAGAAVYDYEAVPGPDESFALALFRIRVPDVQVRGVYFYVDPYLADSRTCVDDPQLQALAATESFALLGALLDSSHMETGVGAAVLRALSAFADAAGHPELTHAAIFFDGWSWGGQFAYHFTLWQPDRVIGFITQKGGYHSRQPAEDAIFVPGYLIIGADDLPYRIANLTDIFTQHRLLGARWLLAMQPDAAHERVTDRQLLDGFVHDVSARRLPQVIPPDGPVPLAVIPESSSWLGERATARIGAYACFDGAVDSASWCVTRDVAVAWQDFVSAGAVTDSIPCDASAVLDSPLSPVLLPPRPNPGNPNVTLIFELRKPGLARLDVLDLAGHLVHTLAHRELSVGTHTVRWDGTDGHGRPVASGTYLVRLASADTERICSLTLVR